MKELYTDVGYVSINHIGEQLCGDHVELVEQDGGDSLVLVLADGLGSGVKASILSTLTAKIISTMMANDLPLEDCVQAIAKTLPICKVRGVAYSTFTILRVTASLEAEIIQYDNPRVILLRDGKGTPYPITERIIDGKTVAQSHVRLREGDTFVAASDGVIHAGVGPKLNFGWQLPNVTAFLEENYDPALTAKTLSAMLISQCEQLYGGEPGDDATVCTVKIRQRNPVNLLFGPPTDPADVNKMLSLFFAKAGKHIVCGGTTSTLASQFLGKPMVADLNYLDPEIPPIAKIEGVDLVTEGVITISKVLEYAKNFLEDNSSYSQWGYKRDGASLIARMLFEEATDINFFVGRAVNPAHQNPNLPITFNIKMQLVDELSKCLQQMGKRIKVSYF